MQIQLNNIDFAIAVNTFSDEVEDKLQILTKMQLQFFRKFQHRVQIAQYHSEMIFEIRRIVSTIEEMYKDVKDYFVEMKVDFVYDFIRKIQTLMVIGYNHLSQALLITLDMYEEQRTKSKEVKPSVVCACQTKRDYVLSKDQFKRLEHIDYTINSLESEEERLLDEMETIYDRMMMQKGLIEKVKPSLASKELEQMKDHMETVMENNEKLFEETYMMKFFQFHNHIQKIDKPEKITEVYNKLNATLKENFIGQAIKTAKRIEHDRRFNPSKMHDIQIQTLDIKAKKKDSPEFQSISSFSKSPNVSSSTLAKQKKLNQKMNMQLNLLQKQNFSLNQELNSYKQAEKQIQIKYRELVQKFSVVQGMYHQTKIELDDVKQQQQFKMQQLIVQNQKIKQEIAALKGRGLSSSTTSKVHIQTEKNIHHPKSRKLIEQPRQLDKDKETQTHEEYLLPANDDEVIKLLKTRNQKAITMLNQKDRKIRDTVTKIQIIQAQNIKIKSTLQIFVGIVQEKFIGSKFQRNDINSTYEFEQSIIEMNSQQIQAKIKKIIQKIYPSITDFNFIQKNESNPPTQVKFKKVTSIKSKPLHTLQDEQLEKDNSNQAFSNVQSVDNYSKTICNFASDSFDQKKKKRFNLMTLFNGKRNSNLIKRDVECQTQFTQTVNVQEEFSHNLSNQNNFIQSNQKQGILIKKKGGSSKNSTKEISTQKMIETKNKRRQQKKNLTIQNSIEETNSKVLNGKNDSTKKLKKYADQKRISSRVISMRRKQSKQKIYLNSFEQIQIKDQANQTERLNHSKSIGRTGLSEYLQANKNSGQASVTWRNSQVELKCIDNLQSIANSIETSPDHVHSNNKHHHMNKIQKQKSTQIGFLSSRFNTYSTANKVFNIREKSTILKGKHNRIASSIVTSQFRPISEASQCDKENQACFNRQNSTRKIQKSFLQYTENSSNPQFLMTAGSSFSKFKADAAESSNKIIRKQKALLLSIQTFKPKQSKTNEMLLERNLTKMIQKWGTQKIYQTFSSLLTQTSS